MSAEVRWPGWEILCVLFVTAIISTGYAISTAGITTGDRDFDSRN
jgi:hypothetical protein